MQTPPKRSVPKQRKKKKKKKKRVDTKKPSLQEARRPHATIISTLLNKLRPHPLLQISTSSLRNAICKSLATAEIGFTGATTPFPFYPRNSIFALSPSSKPLPHIPQPELLQHGTQPVGENPQPQSPSTPRPPGGRNPPSRARCPRAAGRRRSFASIGCRRQVSCSVAKSGSPRRDAKGWSRGRARGGRLCFCCCSGEQGSWKD